MPLEEYILEEKETAQYQLTLKDQDGVVIPNTALSTATLTYFLDDTPATIINGRNAQDILGGVGGSGANNVTFDVNGLMKWSIQTADLAISDTNKHIEKHIARFDVTTTNGVVLRKEIVINVRNFRNLT